MNKNQVDCTALIPQTKCKQLQQWTAQEEGLYSNNLQSNLWTELEWINVWNTLPLSLTRLKRQPAVSSFPFV